VAALGTTMLTPSTADAAYGGFHGNRGGHVRAISHVRHPGHVNLRPRHPGRHWHGHQWRPRHVWYAPRPVVYGVALIAAAPLVSRCTCLTKEYTPEGAVLFKDICTNEAAINPPPAAAPQQTGMLYQSQPQPQAPQQQQ
jgi:hypothetical protein